MSHGEMNEALDHSPSGTALGAAGWSAPASPAIARGERVVVALSGGVDSAVAAWRLRSEGVDVAAVFMKNWEEDDEEGFCAAAEDLHYAEQVCEQLGMELRTVNLSAEYWERVFTQFLAEHRAGRTPNPDVLCNRAIKFDAFVDLALASGATRIATGHYARLATRDSSLRLLKGIDPEKDQSYFLHALDQAQLARVLFPLGGLTKPEVRDMARRAALAPSERKDSTGICFIGERRFRDFLGRYLPPCPGPIETGAGEEVGRHEGLAFYTLGQRQGLRIGGRRGGSGEPWYVVAKDTARNALVVGQGRTHRALYARAVEIDHGHWIRGTAPELPLRCAAKLRHRQPDQRCTVRGSQSGGYRIEFDHRQWAPTPGQCVVLYARTECLGGGVIDRVA